MNKSHKPAAAVGRNARRAGFSLLELMVAMTILAIALVPVAYFYTTSLQMVEKASVRTRALMLAQDRLTEVRQMPYHRIRSNVTPSQEQLRLYSSALSTITIDTTNEDWFGYDFQTSEANHDVAEWAAMFFYPLPLDYNPYRPQRQGYNNALGVPHYSSNNPVTGLSDAHVNFNSGGGGPAGAEIDYEYEPIGFYSQKVFNRNLAMTGDVEPLVGDGGPPDSGDIRMADRRTKTGIEPSIAGGSDYFRIGEQRRVDNYEIYGRRTIILDVRPLPQDADGDNFAADDDRDGGATATNPYPLLKGPDNKFQVLSRHGTSGKMVIVQVFWLPRGADQTYIAWDDLNKVELRTFIAASNEDSNLAAGGGSGGTGASGATGTGAGTTLNRNDLLIISDPE